MNLSPDIMKSPGMTSQGMSFTRDEGSLSKIHLPPSLVPAVSVCYDSMAERHEHQPIVVACGYVWLCVIVCLCDSKALQMFGC